MPVRTAPPGERRIASHRSGVLAFYFVSASRTNWYFLCRRLVLLVNAVFKTLGLGVKGRHLLVEVGQLFFQRLDRIASVSHRRAWPTTESWPDRESSGRARGCAAASSRFRSARDSVPRRPGPA